MDCPRRPQSRASSSASSSPLHTPTSSIQLNTREDTAGDISDHKMPDLLSLPSEIIYHILSFLASPLHLADVGATCSLLHKHATDDQLWLPLVKQNLPSSQHLTLPRNTSARDLYIRHHPYWFLTRHKLWFGDYPDVGRLIVARYDPRLDAIEAYTVAAERPTDTFEIWEWNASVLIHSFEPRVQLDLNTPILRLDSGCRGVGDGNLYQQERLMGNMNSGPAHEGIYSQFMLSRDLPDNAIGPGTQVWPPRRFPAIHRTRNESTSDFRGYGHKPSTLSETSTSSFRLRKWLEFGAAIRGIGVRFNEGVATYATLPEEAYTPTPKKPWRGIWCGDYSGHGCEFLAVLQPDDPAPLPEGAQRTMEEREDGTYIYTGPPAGDDSDTEADDVAEIAELETGPAEASDVMQGQAGEHDIYQGRIEAIKLTGDINIPRGEYTFIAPNIGNDFIRVANEEPFKGARIVKSVGHIAVRGFRHGKSLLYD